MYQLHLKGVAWTEAYLDEINFEVLKPYLNKIRAMATPVRIVRICILNLTVSGMRLNLYLISNANDELVHLLKENFFTLKELRLAIKLNRNGKRNQI